MNAATTNTLPSTVMGRTIERVKVQNIEDLTRVSRGELSEEDVRTVEVDAIVDTGAAFLCLPPDLIEKLGLPYSRTKNVQTANGVVARRQFRAAQITIRDRSDESTCLGLAAGGRAGLPSAKRFGSARRLSSRLELLPLPDPGVNGPGWHS